MAFFFSNSPTLSSHFYPVPTPFPFPFPFHSTASNLVSDLFSSPSFSFSTNTRSHFFFAPPFLIPIVGCTIYFTFTFHSPRGNPASSPRFGIVAPTGRRCDLLALLITTYSYGGEGNVVRCVCVGVWHKSLRFLLGESHGASDRVVLDGMRERRGREFFAPM